MEVLDKPENGWLKDRFKKYGGGDRRSRFAWLVLAFSETAAGKKAVTAEMLKPNGVNVDPDGAFWASPPDRAKLRDFLLSRLDKVPVTVTTTFDPAGAAKDALDAVSSVVSKIPVVGPVLKAEAAPFTAAINVVSGERIDHALLGAMKDQLNAAKAVAPYAATIVSFVPGIGTGVAAAIAAGAALAEGKPIDQALEEAIKAAIPGGAAVAIGYDLAKKVASGENVGKAALETARATLPAAAQKAFDIGVAVTSGKKLQDALVSAVSSLAPGELKQIIDAGANMVKSVPGLSSLAQALPSDIARQGLQLASGALSRAGVNEAQIRAMRSKLTGDLLKGFDTALQSQARHFPWIGNVIGGSAPVAAKSSLPVVEATRLVAQSLPKSPPPPTPHAHEPTPPAPKAAPKPPAPHAAEPTRAASAPAPKPAASPITPIATAGAYPPYPPMGVHGSLGFPHIPHPVHRAGVHPAHHTAPHAGRPWSMPVVPYDPSPVTVVEHCVAFGDAVEVPAAVQSAALAALGASGGRPTTMRAPDGKLYLFALQNGLMTARPCTSFSGE